MILRNLLFLWERGPGQFSSELGEAGFQIAGERFPFLFDDLWGWFSGEASVNGYFQDRSEAVAFP